MKKLSLIVMLIALIGFNAFAQKQQLDIRQNAIASHQMKAHNLPSYTDVRTLDCDTFGNLIDCDDSFFVYTFGPADGFVSGHNSYLDKSKAEKYTGVPGDTLKGLWIWFGDAAATSAAAKITIKVWKDNGAGGIPSTVLASKQITIQSIIPDVTAGNFTTVYFATPIVNPGTFYCGFSMTYPTAAYDPANACALVNTDLNDASGCANDPLRNTAWEQWSDNSWHDYASVYTVGASNLVFPIVCAPVVACNITVTPSSASICKSKSQTLVASGATTYTWSPASGLNVTTGSTVIAKPSSTKTYTVTGDGGACSKTVTVTVTPTPTTTITKDPCSAGHVLLHSNAVPNTGVKYKWYKDNVAIAGATQANFSAAASGDYKVKVTITATTCAKTSKVVSVVVGCREASITENSFDVQASPNPFVSGITINLSSASGEVASASLMDYSGRVVREYTNIDPTSPFEIKDALAPGVYFIKVTQGENTKMLKVVKSN